MKIQKPFETPPLPPFGTAVPTTTDALCFAARFISFISAANFILKDALVAVKRSTRGRKVIKNKNDQSPNKEA